MAHAKHDNLWAVTTGQRVRFSGAIVAMAVANICMFGAPLIAKYAIDVVVAKDVDARHADAGGAAHSGSSRRSRRRTRSRGICCCRPCSRSR